MPIGVIVETGIGVAAAGARPMAKTSPGLNPGDETSWTGVVIGQVLVALASAHTNPASSRAIAVTTTLRLFLRASRRWNLLHSRC